MNKPLSVFLIVAMCCGGSFSSEKSKDKKVLTGGSSKLNPPPPPPSAAVPYLSVPVTLDGRVGAEEWNDAALLRAADSILQSKSHASRSMKISDPATEIRVKYDAQSVYIGVVCHEERNDFPRAEPRPADGNFYMDDAVQVVFGLAEQNELDREVMDMGGYEGAMGAAGVSADNYYQFILNFAGAKQRLWNEVVLDRPAFDGKATHCAEGWSAEFRIPAESFGATIEQLVNMLNSGQDIFFNVIRIRPPDMIGWYLPAYGGYRPMPFGKIYLMPAGRPYDRTLERAPAIPDAAAAESSAEIGYYPLSGSVVGIIEGDVMGADSAVLKVDGFNAVKKEFTPGEDRHLIILDMKPGDQPARDAELTLYQGRSAVKTIQRTLAAVEAPEWLGTDAGLDYLSSKVPAPWTVPAVQGKTAELVDKKIRFGDYALFESILHDGHEILAGPADIVVETLSGRIAFSPSVAQVQIDGNSVAASSSASAEGGAVLEAKSHTDFDGFTVVKMRLRGVEPSAVSRFAVRIPLRRDAAEFAMRVLVQKVMKLDGFGFEGEAGPLWVGTEDRGLNFSFDTPVFYSADKRSQVRIVEEKDRVWLELNFVDAAGQLPAEMPIFRFFLQPTPTKPLVSHFYRPKVEDKWEMWSDYQGYPDMKKIPELSEWAQQVLSKDRLPTLYTCQGLAENSPGFDTFREDLMKTPKWVFYRRRHDPGRGVDCIATCKRGPEGDLQLWGFKKLAEAGICGIMSDGLSPVWTCDNPGHTHGCGRPLDVKWESPADSAVVAQRNFLKRLRGIFSDAGRECVFSAHTGGGIDINTLSFFDFYIDGEQLSRFPTDYQPPLATYAIGYSGRPFGMRGTFWTKRWVRSRGPYWTLPYALLHDNEVRDNLLVQKILTEFSPTEDCEFHPYWIPSDDVVLESASGDSKVSYYTSGGNALVVAANMGLGADQADVQLKNHLAGATSVRDLLTDTVYPVQDGTVSIELPRGQCVALLVEPDAKTSSKVGWKEENSIAGWVLNGSTRGVTLKAVSENGEPGMLLQSTDKMATARIEFAAQSFANGSARFLIRPARRFRIYLGESYLTWYTPRGWTMDGFVPRWGELYQPRIQEDGALIPLDVSVRNGELDVVIDGMPLACGIKGEPQDGPLHIGFATYGGDELLVIPQELSSAPRDLYNGGLISAEVASAVPADAFSITNVIAGQWTLTDGSIVSNDWKKAVRLESGSSLAHAIWNQDLGDTFTIALKFTEMPSRMRFSVGPVALKRSSGRWVIDGPLDGWGNGVGPRTADKAVSPQPTVPDGEPMVLVAAMRNGVLDMVVNNQLLAKGLAHDISDGGNQLSIQTWSGSSVEFEVIRLSSEGTRIYAPARQTHPVR